MTYNVIGIHDSYFAEIIGDIQTGLRELFGAENRRTFLVPAGGSGGMEAAIANFVAPGTKIGIFCAGVFANRMVAIAKRYGANVVTLDKQWGEVFEPEEATRFIEKERPEVVAFVTAETSTGTHQSGRAIAAAARERGAMVIADCVTSLGAMPVEMAAIGIDVAFSCSQKGLSCPAGLSPVSISPRAWERLEQRTAEPSTWYLDLKLMGAYFEPPYTYHHTPSAPLYYAVHEALAIIEEEGLQNRWERHRRAGRHLVAGLERLGFKAFVREPGNRIPSMNTVVPPPGVNDVQLRERLLNEHGIEIALGLGQLAGKVLRIGTMGPLATEENVNILIDAIAACI
jgi:alanine-glyoxylate transaminase/serine-glyoxylate transaminase/serine-pyruvate transaminase